MYYYEAAQESEFSAKGTTLFLLKEQELKQKQPTNVTKAPGSSRAGTVWTMDTERNLILRPIGSQ